MTDHEPQSVHHDELLLADEDQGPVTPDFVATVEDAIVADDAAKVRRLAGDLHEADLATLIEALPAEARPKLIELMGRDFDFAALTEVDPNIRDEIFEELPTQTVAEGMSELEADDALTLLENLDK